MYEPKIRRPEKIDYIKTLICDPSIKDENGNDKVVNTFGPFGTAWVKKYENWKLKPGQYELVVGVEEYEKALAEWKEKVKKAKEFVTVSLNDYDAIKKALDDGYRFESFIKSDAGCFGVYSKVIQEKQNETSV